MLPITDPPPPADASVSVAALNEAGAAIVTWIKPILEVGQEISGYCLQYRRRGFTSYITHSVSGFNTEHTITHLQLGTTYEVRVASVGPFGLRGCYYGNWKAVTTYSSKCVVSSLSTSSALMAPVILILNHYMNGVFYAMSVNTTFVTMSRCCMYLLINYHSMTIEHALNSATTSSLCLVKTTLYISKAIQYPRNSILLHPLHNRCPCTS